MSKLRSVLALALSVGLAGLSAGCKTKPVETTPSVPPPAQVAPPPAPPAEPKQVPKEDFPVREEVKPFTPASIDKLNAQGVLKTVYFDLDKHDLTDGTRTTLRANADWLRANPQYLIVIEGHCDERGSIEYNLALGERRANATREFLVSLGVDATSLRIKTYGEERPAVDGHDESAWSKNRRAEFLFEGTR